MSGRAALLIVPLALGACTPDAPSSPGATTGTVEVGVSTSGDDPPPTYRVALDGGPALHVDANGAVRMEGIPPGPHDVELSAIASNCGVDGENPREVQVFEASTARVDFAVACLALPRGVLAVSTATSGEDVDPDGYGIAIDGVDRGAIGLNETRPFAGLEAGDYEVELIGIADNCGVQGVNPRTLPVSDEQTTPTTFAVVCQLTTGSILVTVETTGFGQDQDGYELSLDGDQRQDVGRDASVTFEEVPEGEHVVGIHDVSSNCEVRPEEDVSVEVSAGETADVAFEVRCGIF